MTSTGLIIAILVTFTGLGLSALFSGLETGMYTLNRVRLAVRAGSGDRAAQLLRSELTNSNRLLSTLLISNNMANYMGSYGVAMLLAGFGLTVGQTVIVNAAILVPVLFVFGETLPKDLFRTHTDAWSYQWAWFLRGCRFILTWTGLLPIVQLFSAALARLLHTESTTATAARQRISTLIKEGVGAGVLTEMQTTLVDRALALRDLRVASVMQPWQHVETLNAERHPGDRLRRLQFHVPRRLPVVGARGNVIGIVDILDVVLDPDRPLRELAQPTITLRANSTLPDALRALRAAKRNVAIVTDARTSAPIGLVTTKDLVQPLTGEPGW